MKKGMELPTNALVIVILAIIVLIALLSMFSGVWGGSSNSFNMENAKNTACQRFISTNACNDYAGRITNADAISIVGQVKCDCNEIATGYDFNADALADTTIKNALMSTLADLAYCCYQRDPITLCCR